MVTRARASRGTEESDAAMTTRTLAVLLQAGAAPRDAWRHLAESGDPIAGRVHARAGSGDLVTAIAAEGGAWADVAAAWELAVTVGAPLAEVLRAVAESMRDVAAMADDVRAALAEPAGTAKLMLWLPAAGLVLGLALGFDTLRVATTTLPGALSILAGLALVLAARRWTARLLAKAAPAPGTPGLHAELTAIALAGGAGVDRARRLVASISGAEAAARTEGVLALSRAAGVPAGELLRASAAAERQRARTQARVRAATLASRLLLPLGVCTLPAFLLLGIAPMALSVLMTGPLSLTP